MVYPYPRRQVAIVGADESDEIGKVPHKTEDMFKAEASRNALRNAGLTMADVDGIAGTGNTLQIAEHLGITKPRWTDGTSVGGSSWLIHVAHAVAAVSLGLANVVLVPHGQGGYIRTLRGRGGGGGGEPYAPSAQFQGPYGLTAAPGSYSIACSRHMYEYGTTHDQLGRIAVNTRAWAVLNPKAYMRDPITLEDYHNSRWVAWPFHLLDCCLVTDGGGAVVVTSAEMAKDLPSKPVYVLGSGESHTHGGIYQMPSLTAMAAAESGRQAFERSGVKHEDLDLINVYDSFTYTALLSLEDLGFCGKGEGGPFVESHDTGPGGDFPMNTNGGGLSYGHTGMYGMYVMMEVVRQLRGECGPRQVPNAKIALAHGTGGSLSSGGTLILGVD